MIKEIKYTLLAAKEPLDCYGFGSFFRGCNSFADIDLLIVSCAPYERLRFVYEDVRLLFEPFAANYRTPVDLLVMTQREFKEEPLRDMHELIFLFGKSTNGSSTSEISVK